MKTAAPLPDYETNWGDDLLLGAFLRPHLNGLHPYLVETDLPGSTRVEVALPPDAVILRKHQRDSTTAVLASAGDELLLFRTGKEWADLFISGTGEDGVLRRKAAVHAACPPPVSEKTVNVSFWRAGRPSHKRSRVLDVPTWSEIRGHYAPATETALGQLMAHRPSADSPGRLVLWHGKPGTGKTTAARALLREWVDDVSGHYIIDPERFFSEPAYLDDVVLTDGDPGWRLVIVEDADELLRLDARERAGQALGRLLNISDGMLGHGLRVLVLLTTNAPLARLHPALTRPGRCLAQIEFLDLPIEQAATVARGPVPHALTLAEAMERRSGIVRVEALDTPPTAGLYL